MRALAASFLLLLHLQPLAGVALCMALGGAEGEGMEAGCPMPVRSDEQHSAPTMTGPVLSAGITHASSHSCIFSDACNTSSTSIRAVRHTVMSVPPHTERVVWPSSPDFSVQSPSPPVPPPRA
jgi:hypothetical protein